MEKEGSMVKRVLAFLFMAVLALWFVKSDSYKTVITLVDYVKQDFLKAVRAGTEEAAAIGGIEEDFTSGLWKRTDMIDFSGQMAIRISISPTADTLWTAPQKPPLITKLNRPLPCGIFWKKTACICCM